MPDRTEEPADDVLIGTAMELIKKLQRTKASKKTVLLLAISIFLDVTLSIVVILLGVGLSHSNSGLVDQENRLRSQELTICNESNATQQEFVSLWILNTEDFHSNALGKSFLKVVEALYIPVDCQQVYGQGTR